MSALGRPHTLTCAPASVSVYDHGAHIVSWAPVGETEVLYLSPLARFDTSVAIRGGIPVIFPWFGPGVSGRMQPAHGFARTARWHLLGTAVDDESVSADFELAFTEATNEEWPFPYELRLHLHAGRELSLELVVRNASDEPVVFEEALHTYLRVGDVERVMIDGLDGAAYFDKANGGIECVQSGPIAFTGEVDRVYSSGADVVVHDPALGRSIRVRKSASGSTIVWNPWVDEARGMADLPDGDWRSYVCIEGGNVREAAVTLAPGESHTMGYSLAVEH